MNSFSKVTMLVRREIWENRSLWIAPLVVSGVLLFIAAVGAIQIGNDAHFGFTFTPDEAGEVGSPKQIYGMVMSIFTLVQMVILGIVVFFYLLDSLLAERKDRSILFWKSLPISDIQVVTSKVLTALVVAPAFVLVLSALTQLLFGVIWSLRGGHGAGGDVLLSFDASTWLRVQTATAIMTPTVVVWYLPIAGYLLLVSVWARKNAFLWTVLPLAAIQLVEGLLMHSNEFAQFIGRRFVGVFQLLDLDDRQNPVGVGQLVSHVGNVLSNYETWLGVLAAAAFFIAVIRIRRYRDDS